MLHSTYYFKLTWYMSCKNTLIFVCLSRTFFFHYIYNKVHFQDLSSSVDRIFGYNINAFPFSVSVVIEYSRVLATEDLCIPFTWVTWGLFLNDLISERNRDLSYPFIFNRTRNRCLIENESISPWKNVHLKGDFYLSNNRSKL